MPVGRERHDFMIHQQGLCFSHCHIWLSTEGIVVAGGWVWDCRLITSFQWHHPDLTGKNISHWHDLHWHHEGEVALLTLGRDKSSGFQWFHPKDKESKVVQIHQGGYLGSPLCLCYKDGNSVPALSMVFGCSRNGGYCLKVLFLSRLFPFFSFGLRG